MFSNCGTQVHLLYQYTVYHRVATAVHSSTFPHYYSQASTILNCTLHFVTLATTVTNWTYCCQYQDAANVHVQTCCNTCCTASSSYLKRGWPLIGKTMQTLQCPSEWHLTSIIFSRDSIQGQFNSPFSYGVCFFFITGSSWRRELQLNQLLWQPEDLNNTLTVLGRLSSDNLYNVGLPVS